MKRLALLMTVLVLVGCYNQSRRGGITPAPPGPIDTISIIFGNDYSRLCPDHYEYCRAGKDSICCPRGACCHDGTAPYCCDGRGDDARRDGYGDDRGDGDRGEGPCGSRSTTCSRAGVTICCSESEGCCADDRGLYCCASSDSRH